MADEKDQFAPYLANNYLNQNGGVMLAQLNTGGGGQAQQGQEQQGAATVPDENSGLGQAYNRFTGKMPTLPVPQEAAKVIQQADQARNASAAQSGQPEAPVRDWGFVKWKANPLPTYLAKGNGYAGQVLGTGIGGLLGSKFGRAGTAAGMAAGTFLGGYAEDALNYFGDPTDVQFAVPPNSEPPVCDENGCDRFD